MNSLCKAVEKNGEAVMQRHRAFTENIKRFKEENMEKYTKGTLKSILTYQMNRPSIFT